MLLDDDRTSTNSVTEANAGAKAQIDSLLNNADESTSAMAGSPGGGAGMAGSCSARTENCRCIALNSEGPRPKPATPLAAFGHGRSPQSTPDEAEKMREIVHAVLTAMQTFPGLQGSRT